MIIVIINGIAPIISWIYREDREIRQGEIAESGYVSAGICDILTVNENRILKDIFLFY